MPEVCVVVWMAVDQENVVQMGHADEDLIQDQDHIFVIHQSLTKSLTNKIARISSGYFIYANCILKFSSSDRVPSFRSAGCSEKPFSLDVFPFETKS